MCVKTRKQIGPIPDWFYYGGGEGDADAEEGVGRFEARPKSSQATAMRDQADRIQTNARSPLRAYRDGQ